MTTNLKPKVIIDTDPGFDDAMALFMALEAHRRQLIDIIAITTTCGNSSIQNVNINVYRVLEIAQLTQIPVFSGAEQGIVKKFISPSFPHHGLDGFGDALSVEDIPNSLTLLQQEHAVLALIRLVEKYSGEIVLVCLAPLTNIAVAMNLCPEFTSKLKDLYVMGGNIYGEGNISNAAEFNFVCDPESAKVVLERSQIPIKITPLETCLHSVNISFEEREKLGSTNTRAAILLNAIEKDAIEKCVYSSWNNCDQLSIARFLDDYTHSFGAELVTKEKVLSATVELSGEHTRGQMVIDRSKDPQKRNLLCLLEINQDIYLKYLQWAFL